jgi:hypothetical protein
MGSRGRRGLKRVDAITGASETVVRHGGRMEVAATDGNDVAFSLESRGSPGSILHWYAFSQPTREIRDSALPVGTAVAMGWFGDALVVGGRRDDAEHYEAGDGGWLVAFDRVSGTRPWTAATRDPVVRLFEFGDGIGAVTGDEQLGCA